MPDQPSFVRMFLIAALVLLASAALPAFPAISPTHAQSEVSISAVEIDLWPEYDRPGVLVTYHITLSPETTLPVDLAFHIPTAAGEPNAVAVKEAGSALLNVGYKRLVNGDVSQITFTATMPEVQVEYYDPNISYQGKMRHFEYFWPADYPVQTMQIKVQEPLGAIEMRMTPTLGNGVKNPDGFVYYTYQVGALVSGQKFTLAMEYTKNDKTLSAERLQLKSSVPVKQISTNQRNLMAILPWLLAVLGVLLIVGGILWYWQTGKSRGSGSRVRRRGNAGVPGAATTQEGHVYCQQCGKRVVLNDRFCRTCGALLSKD